MRLVCSSCGVRSEPYDRLERCGELGPYIVPQDAGWATVAIVECPVGAPCPVVVGERHLCPACQDDGDPGPAHDGRAAAAEAD